MGNSIENETVKIECVQTAMNACETEYKLRTPVPFQKTPGGAVTLVHVRGESSMRYLSIGVAGVSPRRFATFRERKVIPNHIIARKRLGAKSPDSESPSTESHASAPPR